jgi:hypothetical protein
MKRASGVLVFLCLCFAVQGTTSAQQQIPTAKIPVNQPSASEEESSAVSEKLPVRRVVLYKNGVGYFEHLGRVCRSQDVHIAQEKSKETEKQRDAANEKLEAMIDGLQLEATI